MSVKKVGDSSLLSEEEPLIALGYEIVEVLIKALPSLCFENFASERIRSRVQYGAFSRAAPKEYGFRIHRMNISPGVVPFLKSGDKISGSSVTSAIASGVSSLIHSCKEFANKGKGFKPDTRKRVIKEHFFRMMGQDEKYIMLEKFVGLDVQARDGEPVNAKRIILEAFRDPEPPEWI
ncbi:hypothetical protein BGW36DRAFT_358064 [Talaromyces proteolyticus]|uniref:Uncharacterized protein n=1 Tax=Talaromyces proteolyticus TaxID=1131652 RepID=A0AAD4PZ14_9EURO|nr:uncharacterized protein BGW36DRAFT_358064 [Talaromyces proteolyticus]KAH8698531.1 hypothetical protein BGW36DRAFT_358064 [Talaromyces proteolyticus]